MLLVSELIGITDEDAVHYILSDYYKTYLKRYVISYTSACKNVGRDVRPTGVEQPYKVGIMCIQYK